MNKTIKRILVELISVALLLNPLTLYAQSNSENILPENNLCSNVKNRMVIGFFNGFYY